MIPIGSRTAMIVPGVGLPSLALPPLARYPWIDRGAYAAADFPDLAALAPLVAHIPSDDPRRTIACARVVALEAGDYILAHHDPLPAVDGEDLPLELVLDLSPHAVPGADLHYRRRGAVFFVVPSAPRSLAIVERGPTVTANHAYISKRHTGARIVRLFARARATSA